MNKSTNLLFMFTLLMSVILSISANSWFMVWMGMEINMMSFIPLIINQNNLNSKEASLTYFLVQTIASMLMMMSIIMLMINNNMININMSTTGEYLLISSLMMKSGMSPFHFWLPKMMEGINWMNCLILMTWQKITPLMMMSIIIKMNMITIMAMILSITIGAIGGLNQTSLRKLMAYSSISNSGWMMAAMIISENMWIMYFMMYVIMTTAFTMTMNFYKNYHINQMMSMNEKTTVKLMLMLNMLSISGLPPMMGFMPKWIVIQASMSMLELMLMGVLVMLTLITIYYYLRIMFSSMMLSNTEPKWNLNKNPMNKFNLIMNMMSIMGLTMITMMFSLY